MQKTPNPKKSRYFDKIALQVACGHSIKDAAEAAGCSLPMGYAISRAAEFRAAVSDIRTQAIQTAVGVLSDGANKAARCLVELLDNNDPKIRLAAASKLLVSITPMTELHDLRQDIQELRAQLQPQLKVAK